MALARTILLSLFAGLFLVASGEAYGSDSTIIGNPPVAKNAPRSTAPDDGRPLRKPACKCRANGREYDLGDITCFKNNTGLVRARCEMLLNNTRWKTLGNDCELVSLARERVYSTAPSSWQSLQCEIG